MYIYKFGPFSLSKSERILLRGRDMVPLSPKVFHTLLVLVENSGHLVEKDEIIRQVWPDTFVEESNLTNNISILRKALGERLGKNQYIQTVPKRGYRFVAQVEKLERKRVGLKEEPKHLHQTGESLKAKEIAALRARERADSHIGTDSERYRSPESFGLARDTDARPEPNLWSSHLPTGAPLTRGELYPSGYPSELRVIAVLPFKTIRVGDDEQLGLGMADALITRLSNVKQIVVRPTSAVLKYYNPKQDPVAAGRELKVEAVLDGYIQTAGKRIRVTAQLISVRDGASVWAEKFEEQFTDIFSAQDCVSEQLAAALMLKLTGRERELLTKHYTEDAQAYKAYLTGRNFFERRTGEGMKESLKYFETAIEIDSHYALAYSGLAFSYTMLYSYDYLSPDYAVPKARAAVLKALELDDSLAEGHTVLGTLKWYYDWDWAGAEREYRNALGLNPNCATSHQFYSFYLNTQKRFDEAQEEIAFAYQLDPVSPVIKAGLGVPYFFAGQYDRAIEIFRKAIEMDPNFWLAHIFLGEAYKQMGLYSQAITELEKASRMSRTPWGLAKLGQAYAVSGNIEEARNVIDELAEMAKHNYVSPYPTAVIYASLGEKDEAYQWLLKAHEERSAWMVYLKVDPAFHGLQSDIRFDQLLELMRFAN